MTALLVYLLISGIGFPVILAFLIKNLKYKKMYFDLSDKTYKYELLSENGYIFHKDLGKEGKNNESNT